MTASSARVGLTPGEEERLAECAREPIRTPGSIQPHGVLLAVDAETLVITVVSENCAEQLGCESPPLGVPLERLTGPEFADEVRAFALDPDVDANPLRLDHSHHSFDAIVHRANGFLLVELEPLLPTSLRQSTSALYALIHRLAKSTEVGDLRAETVRGLRALTGFDRVMMYHFHPDGHGEVVAEDRVDELEPYLGLHFPASDIPAQARQLYLTKLSRAIVGTSGDTVGLLALDDGMDPATLDLGVAELRSISPHHLEFMRNMGEESTLSFSMVRDGVLVGMITCAHRTILRLPFIMRRGIEVLANQVALQLGALDQVERLNRQVSVRKLRSALMTQVAQTTDLATSLVRGPVTVRDVIEADGAAVRIDGRTRTVGAVPPTAHLEAVFRHVESLWSDEPFASDALSLEYPEVAALAPSVTGILVVLVGGAGDYIAFFRNEVLRNVEWLGDQTDANRATPLSPRMSFSAWTGSVSGTALPWDDQVAEAAELARDLESALLRRAESDLAHLAMHDPLTGLPNRRGLMDQLDVALRTRVEPRDLSVLFIDLDGFKEVNDSFGHDVGDSLIAIVGQRILSATRIGDTVARLGGDEFVVLCDDAGAEEARAVASRVLVAINQPVVMDDVSLAITASVGTAVAENDTNAADFLRRADEAMYRAKESGKNRVSV